MYFKFKHNIIKVLLLLSVTTLLTCNDFEAIFASIETEEKIETNNLSDNATAFGMAKIDDYYFIATGVGMFFRKADSKTWEKSSLPDNFSYVLSITQNVLNEDAYFITYKENSRKNLITEKRLYKFSSQGPSGGFPDITRIDINLVKNLEQIFALPTTLIAVTREGDNNYTYYKDFQTSTPIKIKDNSAKRIEDLAVFNGIKYILVNGALFSVDDTNNTLVEVSIEDNGDKPTGYFVGLHAFDDLGNGNSTAVPTMVFSNQTYIWKTTDGTTWIKSKSHGSFYYFTDFAYINQPGFRGLIVGTKSFPKLGRDRGYRELSDADINTIAVPVGNKYTSGALKTAGVSGFFVDDETNTLFVITRGQGVWQGTYSNTRNIDWLQE